ncbi:sigma-70 family RNA polymerase sigma factor [Daejeonella sp.]|uniref:RNA polymerase sigma factor n=1 Tax=Daejeonella sp. TaxID=2805397 RepID=UPI002BC6CEC3|nr:sigma-70 family RNA polymerase sigma factor [Daejeonella sp.]HQT23386.1 sigma-70 family RNA polymerase sigma factor [Daejeonella sp.]HQT57855.1 sigma-70 family RNA polymerase sigma factor [Daejeonella sp.]
MDIHIEDSNKSRIGRSRKLRLSEDKLIEGLKNMDGSAMSALYRMYSDSLYRVISTIVVIEEVAQDLLQETFIKIWKSFKQYDPGKGRLYTWMARLARNISIDYLRSVNYRNYTVSENLSESTQQIDQKFQVSYNPELIGVKDMTNILNEDQRLALDLIYFKGYTHVQAAEELNITVGILRSRLQSSITELRRTFNREYLA